MGKKQLASFWAQGCSPSTRERKALGSCRPCWRRDAGSPPSLWLLPPSPQPGSAGEWGQGRGKGGKTGAGGTPRLHNSSEFSLTLCDRGSLGLSPAVPFGARAHSLPYGSPAPGVPPGGKERSGHQCLAPPPSLIHTPRVFRKVGSLSTCHSPRGSSPPADTIPRVPDIASLPGLAHAPACLPASAPDPLAHPGQLRPVLPAPGGGLSARAASLNTSTRSQSSARMVGARTRPRPAAAPGPG